MKRILVIAAAAAGIAFATSGANAQELTSATPPTYEPATSGSIEGTQQSGIMAPDMTSATPPPYEPATTGSIGRGAPPLAAAMAPEASDPSGCTPGGYWWIRSHDAATPMKCR